MDKDVDYFVDMKPWIDDPLYPKKELELTETDMSFDAARPGYYIFEEEVCKPWDNAEGKCLNCRRKFTTHLLLCRFCSWECQRAVLEGLSTLSHATKARPLSERVKVPPATATVAEVIKMVKAEGLEIATGKDMEKELEEKFAARRKAKTEWQARKRAEERAAKGLVE